ncbi:hypothetical protein [Streptomyces sp. NPDC056527]|uniref:hypothetical protein n=1 Tax=Streptomyces sp. NPDC056527 TaxID=3345853 RepID=UPI0036AA768C
MKEQPAIPADISAALEALASRYEEIADRATTTQGRERALQIRRVASDIRTVVATAQLPSYLRPSTEPEAPAG